MLKKSLGLVSGAALMFVFAYGCSSSSTETPAGTDGGGTDGAVKSDGGAKDAPTSTDAPTGDTCKPGDVSSFAPAWKKPSPFNQKICSNTQVEAIISCIFDENADKATCDKVNADKSNQPCADCLLTPDTAKALGPVVIKGQVGSLNISGCIANASGDTSANGCGAKYQAADDCAAAACDDNCPGTDAAALKALQACNQQALQGDCAKYADPANSCSQPLLDTGGAAEACASGNSFLDAAIILGKLFCAGGAGGEGGADAPSEGG